MAKKTPQINSSSTADIAFLLLCYFLMTTTMGDKTGIQRKLPRMPDPTQKTKDIEINRRNLIQVKINSSDNVLLIAGERSIPVRRKADGTLNDREITEYMKLWLNNGIASDNEKLPQREDKVISGKTYSVSKGVISLQNDRSTHYDTYILVQNSIVRAINELRDEFAQRTFKKPYSKLNQEELDIVKDAVPQNISEAEPKDKNKTK